jgi:hypothetical protein
VPVIVVNKVSILRVDGKWKKKTISFMFSVILISICFNFRDPVTGLGVLNFTSFYNLASKLLITRSPTVFPTATPTLSPSDAGKITAVPTAAPTNMPPPIVFYGIQVQRNFFMVFLLRFLIFSSLFPYSGFSWC